MFPGPDTCLQILCIVPFSALICHLLDSSWIISTILAELIIPLETLDVRLLLFWLGYISAWGASFHSATLFLLCLFPQDLSAFLVFPPALRVDLDHKVMLPSTSTSLPRVRCRGQAERWNAAFCKV